MNGKITTSTLASAAIVMGMNTLSPALGHDDGFGGGQSECVDTLVQTSETPVHPHLIEASSAEAKIDRNGNGLVCEIQLESCRDSSSPCRIVYDDHMKGN